ncbi:heterokaryon incompatibility protein-domain-containing protein [Nemania diffusa]|nr:heterokaryon incompatibility protein-domain-containing protein [Nemania diffusa]
MYSNLPSDRHIRLLWVLPKLDGNKVIHCSLEVADLDNHPPFDCLSYTWINPLGLPESSPEFQEEKRNPLGEQIVCDGKTLPASRNLLQCLQFFQQKGLYVRSADGPPSSSARPIWIDAVCINQENPEEKPKQIVMMSDIYARAHRVLIWLGPGDEHSRHATSVINRLASVAKGVSGLQYHDLDTEDPCPKLGIEPSISRQEWSSYVSLLQRAWFSRVWVAQEAYFAKSIVVFSGETEITWKNLVRSARVLQETGLAEALQNMVQSHNDAETPVVASPTRSPELEPNAPPSNSFSAMKSSLNNQFILTVFGGEEKKESFTLEDLLSYARYLDAGLAPDKVFGLRGIWQQTASAKKFEPLVPVDYKRPVSDIFMDATYAAICETENLNVLRLVGQPPLTRIGTSVPLDLPSWVPDYTCWPQLYSINVSKSSAIADKNDKLATVSRGEPRMLPHGAEAEIYSTWKADGGKAWHIPSLEGQLKCLTIKGTMFEAIVDIGPVYQQIDIHGFHHLLRYLGEYPSEASPYGPSSSMAWLQTLLAGKYRSQHAGHEAVQAFHDLTAVFVKELEEALEFSKFAELPDASDLEMRLEQTKEVINDLSARQSNRGVIPTWAEVQRLIEISLRDSDQDAEKRRMDSGTDAIRQSFDRAYMGRRIFRTTSNYWGISSESLKEGDEVFIISTADTPYVLRKSNWGWKVIGEAYVHGIMHGEAAQGLFKDLKLV